MGDRCPCGIWFVTQGITLLEAKVSTSGCLVTKDSRPCVRCCLGNMIILLECHGHKKPPPPNTR